MQPKTPCGARFSAGLTLLEMTVVMIIVSVMAGMALFDVGPFLRSADDQKRVADILSVKVALGEYRLINNAYPAGTYCEAAQQLVSGGFINGVPKDPKASSCASAANTYAYTACGGNKKYVLRTTLKDARAEYLNNYAELDDIPPAWGCPAFDCTDANKQYCVSE